MDFLSKDALDELRQFDTPTISNGIEFFELGARNKGFMNPSIKSALAIDVPMVGYAVTLKCSAMSPPQPDQLSLLEKHYENLLNTPDSVTVVQDIDPSPIGSFWGEVNASIHKSLGSVGTITQGGVRDLAEVEQIGFGYFSTCLLVSHAYVHPEKVGCPVEVGGMTVYPKNLIHADRHGALVIPREIASELPEACRAAMYAEEPVILNCREAYKKGEKVKIEDLIGWRKELQARKKEAFTKFSRNK